MAPPQSYRPNRPANNNENRIRVDFTTNTATVDQLLLICSNLKCPCTRVFPRPNTSGVICIFRNAEDADKFRAAKKQLVKKGFALPASPEDRARRTVFARQLDSRVGSMLPADLITDIEQKNPGIKISELFKIKDYTHVVKITTQTIQMAERLEKEGFLAGTFAIAPRQVEREMFQHVKMCFHCYQLETHQSKNCPRKDKKVCSECSGTDHTFKDCTSAVKKCLNCHGPHREGAMRPL